MNERIDLPRRFAVPEDARRQALAKLLSSGAHQLRAPISAVRGAVELLSEDLPKSGDVRELLAILERNLRRIETSVTDTALFARLALGCIALEKRDLVVKQTIDAVVRAFEDAARRKCQRIDVEVDSLLRAVVDEAALFVIAAHLLDNALRFAPERTAVLLQAEVVDSALSLRVVDSGKGIPLADRARLVEPYEHRATPTDPESFGAGLGLAIVESLARLHGGALVLADAPGRGLEAAVTLR